MHLEIDYRLNSYSKAFWAYHKSPFESIIFYDFNAKERDIITIINTLSLNEQLSVAAQTNRTSAAPKHNKELQADSRMGMEIAELRPQACMIFLYENLLKNTRYERFRKPLAMLIAINATRPDQLSHVF